MQITPATTAATRQGPEDWFTGRVWIERIDEPAYSPLRASRVYFSAGARTAWHTHPVGQTLHIVEGVARVQSEGSAVSEVSAGDTVSFEPGERHWHGATPGRPMVHLALQVAAEGGAIADWGEKVTDEEYDAAG
jgi:quercetin dioxygenase-like cupin family protein